MSLCPPPHFLTDLLIFLVKNAKYLLSIFLKFNSEFFSYIILHCLPNKIYVGLQSAMGTLKCDGHSKVRWFVLKCDGMTH